MVQSRAFAVDGKERCNMLRNVSRTVANCLQVKSEEGVTAIEYGLIASLIGLAIIVGVTLVGTNLNGLFNYIGGKVAAP